MRVTVFSGRKNAIAPRYFPFALDAPPFVRNARMRRENDDGKRYRLSIAWYFGKPDAYRNSSYSRDNKGTNFQMPQHFCGALCSSVAHPCRPVSIQDNAHQLKSHRQASVCYAFGLGAYLCCLQQDQALKTVELMKQWVQQRDFDFKVKFDRLECWHERLNSVTNILQVDEASQLTIMGILQDLEHFLEYHNIPIVVPRTEQMPFHVTVIGVRLGEPDESDAPQDDITSWLPQIHSTVQELDDSSHFSGAAWTGENGFSHPRTSHSFLQPQNCTRKF